MAGSGGDSEAVGLLVSRMANAAFARLRGGEEDPTLTLSVDVDGTELVVSLHDLGEPVMEVPDEILLMLHAGIATSATALPSIQGNAMDVRFALPAHHRLLDASAIEEADAEPVLSAEDVTIRELLPSDAIELTRTVYRCYGWTYSNAAFYYPDRIAAQIESGQRIGEVAVAPDGTIAAHWGAVYLTPTVVETGAAVTDPRFRRRGLAKALGDRLLDRLVVLAVRGRLREPVLTHSATQQIALDEGASIVGAYLCLRKPVQQVGITDGLLTHRGSLSIAYSALRPLAPALLWIPHVYESMVNRVLAAADWPRECMHIVKETSPMRTRLATTFDTDQRAGIIDVSVSGSDLAERVGSAMREQQAAGAEHIRVILPANQPATSRHGEGLTEFGLAFAGVIPEYRPVAPGLEGADDHGDVLVLQWLIDSAVETSDWVFANDAVRGIVMSIADQVKALGDRQISRQNREAKRAELFAALLEDDGS